ncbi:MAG: 50S ribosomal protein L23 [Bacteroidia bacterium]
MNVLIKPLFTEKATRLAQKPDKKGCHTYIFQVIPQATKPQIAQAIEKTYQVKVENVRTHILPAKHRKRYTRKGVIEGRIASRKLAYVKLQPGKQINIYENI